MTGLVVDRFDSGASTYQMLPNILASVNANPQVEVEADE